MTKDGKRKPGKQSALNKRFGCDRIGQMFNPSTTVQYEEDDGFQFSRKPSKKSRPSIEAIPENLNSDIENAPPKATPRRGRPPKKRPEDTTGSSGGPAKGVPMELPSRRPTRGSGRTDTESEAQSVIESRSAHPRDTSEHQPEAKKPRKGRPPKAKAPETNGYQSPEQPPAGTKVALHTADTPVIQRNKELRGGKGDKKGRRSSLSRRGRRASDLIDSGTSNGRFTCLSRTVGVNY
jgi:kinetochore protein Mis13/DSN1